MKFSIVLNGLFAFMLLSYISSSNSNDFMNMLQNAENLKKSLQLFNSFLYKQPEIIHCGLQQMPRGDDTYSIENYINFIFQFGSWEFEPINISINENETVIYIFKEEYILDKEAELEFNKFCRENRKKSKKIMNFFKIEIKGREILMICFDKKGSKFVKFYCSKTSRCLCTISKLFCLDKLYQKLIYLHVDKLIEVPIKKYISLDKEKYKYKFDIKKSGILDDFSIGRKRNYSRSYLW